MIIFLYTVGTFAPWVAIGLTLVVMIVATSNSINKKADRTEAVSKEHHKTVVDNCKTDKENVWAEIKTNRQGINALAETRGEMKAYVTQLKEMVNELKKMNRG